MRRAQNMLAVLTIALAGCSIPEPPSAIVRRAEAAGSGDLQPVATLAMQAWLEQHRDLSQELDRACAQVRGQAAARWADTTEGRLCNAARTVAVSTFRPFESDHKTYGAGWK